MVKAGVAMVEEFFEVAVVGSGFGGAVTACRAAQAGRKVLVLERGKQYRPEEFRQSLLEISTSFWDPTAGLFGLFQVWSFRHLDAVVPSGVGGGSLIHANATARMPETWFGASAQHWPLEYSDIDEHYGTVETMIGAGPVPPTLHGRDTTAAVLADTAPKAGMSTREVPYLSEAQRCGAEIRPLHEVKQITAISGGYELAYVMHRSAHPAGELPRRPAFKRIRAKTVVLAAGALGSTWLLLTNRPGLPYLSGQLGTRFSANDDVPGLVPQDQERAHHLRHRRYPAAGNWRGESLSPAPGGCHSHSTLPRPATDWDPSMGRMRLADGHLELDWPAAEPREDGCRFRRLIRQLHPRRPSRPLDPQDPSRLSHRALTAHPLGGCPMGKDAAYGVVDKHGEAFGHPGLFVADGSVLPAPVGASPSLTIAALAERFAHTIVKRSR
jgi:cholesterol oxidase